MEADAAQVIEEITNKVILGGDISIDGMGMHLFLSDGRTLIVVGGISVGLLSTETIQ